MQQPPRTVVVDGVAAFSWATWLASHLTAIDQVLQTVVLILGCISGAFAVYWHLKRLLNRKAEDT